MNLRLVLLICVVFAPSLHADETLKSRELEPATVEAGRTLFSQHCMVCHGAKGVGPKSDWRKRDADGKLPPPPLNGSAHTWHHSNEQLMEVIKTGSVAFGENMPAWGDKLSESEIVSILAYVKSLWPDEVYKIWRDQWGQR